MSTPSFTDSIKTDIQSSLAKSPRVAYKPMEPPTASPLPSPSPSPSKAKNAESFSTFFFFLIFTVFACLVFLVLYYFYYKPDQHGSWVDRVWQFLPSFQDKKVTPTVTVTTPPVSTMTPTSIPTSYLHDQVNDTPPVLLKKEEEDKIKKHKKVFEFKEDDAHSQQQQNKRTGKAGWCFVGEDRGFRSCARISESDTCISGDIFPSQDMCINPTLRYT